ncbi:glycosyltransferase family 2 protein [Campylobacter sp. RM12642]|uniref:glycosyltransferase family 2 protein n=1 Tax=Campylobacter sp. RM12642 TaxID=2735736 RepID=UPI0030154B60|nr:glycosyltransferase family 2 protein [Campylobacter sp. RM12642]
MTIIFPMAGLSSRFFKAGYKIPKYMLLINNNTLFYEVISGFNKYFNGCNFLFICKKDYSTKDFIIKECKKLNLKTYMIIELDFDTLGQAHTVYLGLEKSNIKDDILIFNIDTIRPNFQLPNEEFLANCDGYLEVFEADGDNWSFILPGTDNLVLKTTEKERISSLCSSGLYYFKNSNDFITIFQTMLANNETSKNEYYIAPMYNYLIKDKKVIKYYQIKQNEIIPCGTPNEYEMIIKKEQNVKYYNLCI